MKVDIITLHYINHYGSLLQTYATCKAFERMGVEAEVIDYIRPNADEKLQMQAALAAKNYKRRSIKGVLFELLKRIENKKRKDFSDRFINKYVTMTRRYKNYDDLKNNPPIADIYCTGSDQTWNSDYNGGLLPAYFLDFAPEGKKRIGYSVSIGMPEFPEAEYEQTKSYIHKYNAISVRENSALKLIQEMGYRNVTHILDPTLVLDKEDWEPLISSRLIKDKYILIYKLNTIPEIEQFAERLAKQTGYRIVRMSYYLNHFKYKGKMIYSPEVEEFLSLISNAEYVITDSFHCLAFSINFEKEFFAFYPGQYSSRLRSLIELIDTKDRVVINLDNMINLNEKINYVEVKKIIDKERQKAIGFLEQCIN